MRLKFSKYIISLFFISLLLFKGAVCVVTVFSSHFKLPITELVSEEAKENKGNTKAETSIDEELFGKALLPDDYSLPVFNNKQRRHHAAETLNDVYLDTVTPPPLSC